MARKCVVRLSAADRMLLTDLTSAGGAEIVAALDGGERTVEDVRRAW